MDFDTKELLALPTYLSAQSQRDVSATLLCIEPKGAGDFFHSIPRASFLAGFGSRAFGEKALVAIASNAIHCLLAKENERIPLDIPQTERGIMEAVTNRGLSIFRETWINIIDLSPSVEWIDDEPKINRINAPDTQILSIEIEIRIQDVLGILMIGLPPGFLVSIAGRLNDPSVADLWKDPGEKLTKGQMTAVQNLHEKFSRSLAELLSEWSKTPVKASLISLEQFSFEKFLRSIQRPGFMAVFRKEMNQIHRSGDFSC